MAESGPNNRGNIPSPERIPKTDITAFHGQVVRLFTEAAEPFSVVDGRMLQAPDLPLDRARYFRPGGKVINVVVLEDQSLHNKGQPDTIENTGVTIDSPLPSTASWVNTYISELFILGNPLAPLHHRLNIVEYDREGRPLRDEEPEQQLEEAAEVLDSDTIDKFRRLQSDFPEETADFELSIKYEHFLDQLALLRRTTRDDEIGYYFNPYKRRLWPV